MALRVRQPRLLAPYPLTPATLDPAKIGTNVVLSNGNLTFDNNAAEDNIAVATVAMATPFYFEAAIGVVGSSMGIGICNASRTNFDDYLGDGNDSLQWSNVGQIFRDNAVDYSTGSGGSYTTGDRIQFCIDPANKRIWFNKNNTGWLGLSGSGAPGAGLTGYSFSAMQNGPYFPAISAADAATSVTFAFSPADWLYKAPAGFTPVGYQTDQDGWDITRASTPSKFQLGNNDRYVTRTDPSGDETIQSKWFKTTGKWYYEILWTESTGFASGAGFIEDSAGPLPSGEFLGSTNTVSEGGFNDNDNWNAANAGYWDAPFNDGDILCVALDLDNDRSWSRRNNGSWFGNNSTPGDPATNTGGHVIGAGLTGAIRAIAQIADPGTRPIATSAFKASQWTYSAPSGFSAPVADASTSNIWFQQTAFQIWPVVGGGGTTYNEGITEAITTSDAFGGVAVFLRAITESAATSDTFGGTAAFVRAMTETIATSDAFTGTMAATGAIAESVALADAPAATLTLSAAIAETMAATDASSASLTMLGAIAESVALTDAPNATAVFNRAIGETVALTDAHAANITMAAAIAESMAATDAFGGGLLFVVAVNESIALTDAQTGLLVMLCERAEIMSIADAQNATASLVVGITESVATSDSVSAALAAIGAVAETIATSDAYSGGSVYAMTVNESIGIADSQSVLVTLVGSVAEALALADTAGTTLVAVAQVAETIATSDAYNEDGPPPPGTDEYRVGGGSVQELLQTLTVSTIHHTQKKTGPS
jgi:hypothetical protein